MQTQKHIFHFHSAAFFKSLALLFLFFLSVNAFAQLPDTLSDSSVNIQTFDLQQLKEYGLMHSRSMQKADWEIKKARARRWEAISAGLPQVSANAEIQRFFDVPTQLMPDFLTPAIVGVNQQVFHLHPKAPLPENKKMPVKFGSDYNFRFGGTVSQLIFSGEYIVGLSASKIYLSLSEKLKEKSIAEIKKNIEKTYYLILISRESIEVLDSVKQSLNNLIDQNTQLEQVGFIEATDVEQITLNLKETENSLLTFKEQENNLYRLLKYQTGIPENDSIQISGSLENIVQNIVDTDILGQNIDITQNIDYRLLQTTELLKERQVRLQEVSVLPTLSAYYSYTRQAMEDSFALFDKATRWHPTSLLGLKLSIPVLSGGRRHAKIRQARAEYEQNKIDRLDAEHSLQLQIDQSKTNYLAELNRLKNKEQQRNLAKKIYENSLTKFAAGVETSFALSQKQMQYFQSLTAYYQSLSSFIEQQLNLKKLLNQL
ncbi:MAG: hypothetical protein CSB06_00155 [Bacteroidia bacterium]|nr:MAG: hypothetical protein CSB06_00155 [Bacteroidia bacterium]